MTQETAGVGRVSSRPWGWRVLKRLAETVAVALPGLFVFAAMVPLPKSLRVVPETWVFLAAIALLAAAVFTQHWTAYMLLLAAGLFLFSSTGILTLAAWFFGAVYLVIALPNLIAFAMRRRS